MGFFSWDPTKYSVYVPEMDKEHQELIRLMNEVFEKNELQKSKPEILVSLKKLKDFVVLHFQHEEDFFSKLPNYSNADAHKKIHKDLLARFNDLLVQYESGSSPHLSHSFFHFLKVWLTAHIAGCDRQYGMSHQQSKAS